MEGMLTLLKQMGAFPPPFSFFTPKALDPFYIL
jgi:hypothetical protein